MGTTCCVQKLFLAFRTISVHNTQHVLPMLAKRRASDKDLPVVKLLNSKVLKVKFYHKYISNYEKPWSNWRIINFSTDLSIYPHNVSKCTMQPQHYDLRKETNKLYILCWLCRNITLKKGLVHFAHQSSGYIKVLLLEGCCW